MFRITTTLTIINSTFSFIKIKTKTKFHTCNFATTNKKCEYMDKIKEMFNKNIKNKEITNISKTFNEGYWLEQQLQISKNSNNEPDIFGYELKKYSPKITFGDYTASEYIFYQNKPFLHEENKESPEFYNVSQISRNNFIQFFGNSNPKKNGRYSWCGSCVPKYNIWNKHGQILTVNENKDVCIYYSHKKDRRSGIVIPEFLQQREKTMIAIWKKDKLKKNIENKFNQRGFVICKKKGNTFQEIIFGKPFDYDYFIEKLKDGKIVFESSMKEGCNRNYSYFRASVNDFWKDLFINDN